MGSRAAGWRRLCSVHIYLDLEEYHLFLHCMGHHSSCTLVLVLRRAGKASWGPTTEKISTWLTPVIPSLEWNGRARVAQVPPLHSRGNSFCRSDEEVIKLSQLRVLLKEVARTRTEVGLAKARLVSAPQRTGPIPFMPMGFLGTGNLISQCHILLLLLGLCQRGLDDRDEK
jgi:hypothetical protein